MSAAGREASQVLVCPGARLACLYEQGTPSPAIRRAEAYTEENSDMIGTRLLSTSLGIAGLLSLGCSAEVLDAGEADDPGENDVAAMEEPILSLGFGSFEILWWTLGSGSTPQYKPAVRLVASNFDDTGTVPFFWDYEVFLPDMPQTSRPDVSTYKSTVVNLHSNEPYISVGDRNLWYGDTRVTTAMNGYARIIFSTASESRWTAFPPPCGVSIPTWKLVHYDGNLKVPTGRCYCADPGYIGRWRQVASTPDGVLHFACTSS
jgi:hypothetical protein